MQAFLEYAYDKFAFRIATDRRYNAQGLWAKEEHGLVTVGLSDFLQLRSGDIAFVDIAVQGTELHFGDEVATIETIKVDASLPAPVSGTIAETNPALEAHPELINEDPYGRGWLAAIRATRWSSDQDQLLDAASYLALAKREVEAELENR